MIDFAQRSSPARASCRSRSVRVRPPSPTAPSRRKSRRRMPSQYGCELCPKASIRILGIDGTAGRPRAAGVVIRRLKRSSHTTRVAASVISGLRTSRPRDWSISLDGRDRLGHHLDKDRSRSSRRVRLAFTRHSMFPRSSLTIFGALLVVAAARADGPQLRVYPESITLNGPRSAQRLIVLATDTQGRTQDLTRDAAIGIDNAKVAAVRGGSVIPVGDGKANITVSAAGAKAIVPVSVANASADVPVSFVREVEPILTKAGCNSGGCHGSQHGRGGFRLSLFGFDPAFDYSQIVQSSEGRRVVAPDPERSILLLKPSLVMEHGGGERLPHRGPAYETLRRWLEDGTPEPEATPPTVTRLSVFPPSRVVAPGETQQLAVTAVWSDGRSDDVTASTQFDALNEAVAGVTRDGLVTAKAKGEAHVMVRFAGQAAVARFTLPFARIDPYPDLPRNNFIDEKLIPRWRALGITPSALTTDEEFLRRLYLDAIGTLPTPDEVKAFLAGRAADKRTKAIDRVLDRTEFVDFWAVKWGDLLRINRDALTDKGMWSFHNWVRGALRDRKPVDEFVRDIITAEGSTFTEGPANFYRVGRTADEWAETTSQVFLGVRVQCAKCHHHPFEKWSQEDYYGLTAFFTRLGTKNSQEFGIFGQESVIFLRNTGDATHPRTRKVVKPHPLDGPAMDDEFDRRAKLADWLTAKDNPFFARNIVNRFWGYLMGRGLVEPLDDIRATNPASNPELLDALAKDFADHQFDLKHLLRTILNSRAWQLSSAVEPGNAADATNTCFARYTTKRLSAEQLADAIDFATGTREKYAGLPLGTRAIQLPDPRVRSYLMDVFGRPARQVACECERTAQPNIAQALHLLHGDFLNRKSADAKGRIETGMKAKRDTKEMIAELYMVTLSRAPRPEEMSKASGWVGSATDTREGLQDLLWTLLNSREFLFNH